MIRDEFKIRISFLFCALLALGCNPLVDSASTDGNFNPGVSTVSTSLPTPTASPATLFADQTDNTFADFSAGSGLGTVPDSTHNYVRLDQTGTATNHSELDSSWTPEWSNLVGYWKLNGSITTPVTAGSAIPATVGTNGTAEGSDTTYVSSKLNQGMVFNGSDNDVNLESFTGLDHATQMTIAMWIKPASLPFGNWNGLFALGSGGNRTAWFQGVYGASTVALNFNVEGQGLVGCNIPNTSLMANVWTHILVTWDGITCATYFNGVLDNAGGTTPSGPVVASDGWNYIGYMNGYQHFNGAFDDVAVWNKALTKSEAQLIYNRQVIKYSGTFTSRVLNGLSASANWQNFSWITPLPFFKRLPDSNIPLNPVVETAASYPSIVDATTTPGSTHNLMDNIFGLWHLSESSSAITAIDTSGNSHNGAATGVVFGGSGPFGSSAQFDGSTSSINMGNVNPQNTNGDLSVAFWVNPSATQNAITDILSKHGDGGASFVIEGGASSNAYYFAWGNGSGSFTCANNSLQLTSGQWQHVAFVKSGATVYYYVNGAPPASGPTSCAGAFSAIATNSDNLYIGRCASVSGRNFAGSLDEFGIWSRALSATEVQELYRRAANRIQYQLRTCTAADCSDDVTNANWKGPDNSNQTYFSELNNTALNAVSGTIEATPPEMLFTNFVNLIVPSHQYFQYRALMESDDTGANCNYGAGPTWCSPELKSATVGPDHQP